MAEAYSHQSIEPKWQERWTAAKAFKTPELSPGDEKLYVLDFFPYPSGAGLHVGHIFGYTGTDILARIARMQGKKVLHPMGWDAFGLPAENYAIKSGVHPAISTAANIQEFKRQFAQIGASYDWDKEINASSPEYYKWTQWMFKLLYERGLAYRKDGLVNWCESCHTVLANEQVVQGRCERCGTEVVQKQLKQWYFKITDYAERLLSDLEGLDWPEKIKIMQRNWIGKSEGAQIFFQVQGLEHRIEVFTTRPDTIFGATYLVLAPEHELVSSLATPEQAVQVKEYQDKASRETELERTFTDRPKTGVFTGSYAINPATGQSIPIWIADYVLATYGTGAIMAVPAHDERDYDFAQIFKLPIIQVVRKEKAPIRSYLMGGEAISDEMLKELGVRIIEKNERGNRKVEIPANALDAYEALIGAHMTPGYWNEYLGEETVFLFKDKEGSVERLVLSPATEQEIDQKAAEWNDQPWEPQSVWGWLASNDWYTDVIIHAEKGVLINSGQFSGKTSQEALDELLAFVGGSKKVTYRLRDWLVSRQRFWGSPIPILYDEEGNEHLLSDEELPVTLPMDAQFLPTGQSPLALASEWNTVVKEGKTYRREVDTLDTFVCSSWYYLRFPTPHNSEAAFDRRAMEQWLPVDMYVGGSEHAVLHLLYARFFTKVLYDAGLVPFQEPFASLRNQGMILGPDHNKMSKSKGNVVSPDEVVAQYGADTLRTYELFMGPFDQEKPWSTTGVVGVRRFLEKVWRLQDVLSDDVPDDEELRIINRAVKKVSDDTVDLKFNTAISAMMETVNAFTDRKKLHRSSFEKLLLILNPYAPHITEELWQLLGNEAFCSLAAWPVADDSCLRETAIEYPVQINGKVRFRLSASPETAEKDLLEQAKNHAKAIEWLAGATIIKEIVVPGRLISFAIQKNS